MASTRDDPRISPRSPAEEARAGAARRRSSARSCSGRRSLSLVDQLCRSWSRSSSRRSRSSRKIELVVALERDVVSRDAGDFDIPTLLRSARSMVAVIAMVDRGTARARRGDVPVRVRQPERSAGDSSRSSRRSRASRAWCSATSRSQVINPEIVQNLIGRLERVHDHGGGHRRRHPHDPAWSPRSPRTRCTRSPPRSARPRTGSGADAGR